MKLTQKMKLNMLLERMIKKVLNEETGPNKNMTAKVAYNYLFKHFHSKLDYMSEPLKTNAGTKIIEMESNNSEILSQIKSWAETNGIEIGKSKFNRITLYLIFQK